MGELKYNEIDVNAVCFGILCNFPQFCGDERAKEAAALVRKIYEDNKNLLDRAKSAEVRAETIEKMVKEYQDEIVQGYREQAEKAERERDELKARYCAAEPCVTCENYKNPACGGEGDCLGCKLNCPCNKCNDYSMWKWNGDKVD